MKIALYDFDETLTRQNSLWCLLKLAAKAKPKFAMQIIAQSLIFPAHRNKLEKDLNWHQISWLCHSKRTFRHQLYLALTQHFEKSDLYDMGREAAKTIEINEPVVELLMKYRQQGHESWIVTGSLEPFVEGVRDQLDWPIARVVGTQWDPLSMRNPDFKECLRHEKVNRIRSLWDCMPAKSRETVAFGNLPDDGPMLMLAEKSFSVSKGKPSLVIN
jgi:phosphoserine phosphatase